MNIWQLSYEQQLALLKLRGIAEINLNYVELSKLRLNKTRYLSYQRQLRSIESIGYYVIKEYANPFYNGKRYNGIKFDDIVNRYFYDKHLKQHVLQAIETIEVALNAKIAHILGNRCGAFGYLDFNNWCQLSGINGYLGKNKKVNKYLLQDEELRFKKKLANAVRKSSNPDIIDFIGTTQNIYPSVWLMVGMLDFGGSVRILKLMDEELRKEVAKYFKLSEYDLIKWLETINLIRNICCHNRNFIDFSLRTKPPINDRIKPFLYSHSEGKKIVYTNKVALPILMIVYLVKAINPRYDIGKLMKSVRKFATSDSEAQKIGFENKKSIGIKRINLSI